MGGICTTGVENLPTSEKVIQGTDIPEWVSAGGKILFEQAAELASSAYPGYEGARIATYTDPETGAVSKLTPEEQKGFELLSEGTDVYQSYLDDAKAMADTLGAGYTGETRENLIGDDFSIAAAQPFLDIYQTAADPAVAQAQETFEQKLIADRAKAVGSGAFGGSRAYLGELAETEDIAKVTGDIRAEAAARGLDFAANRFDADREARFGAEAAQRAAFEVDEASKLRATEQLQSFAPLVQGLQEQAASGMLSAGEAQRKLDQMALDLAFADYVEQREFPFQQLNFAMGALKGVPYETTQYSLSQGQQYVQTPSIYGQTLGGLGSLASAYYLSQR